MVKDIIQDVNDTLSDLFKRMEETDYNSFILFIARADWDPMLKQHIGMGCVTDYELDRYYDETREKFYLRYLNKNYHNDDFFYQGEQGIDDLSVEMMIYAHLWASNYFLKSVIRASNIVLGNGYIWEHIIPEKDFWKYMHNDIIEPLKAKNIPLGFVLEKAYSSDIRNAFAHSLYTVDVEHKLLTIRPKTGQKILNFNEFQKKFLYSVILMNRMQNILEYNRNKCAEEINGQLTYPFKSYDGIMVKMLVKQKQINGKSYPMYNLVKCNE